VRATRFNHVSIHVEDMEESVRFYTEVLGMERLPSPNFEMPVEWLRLGDQQLHLFRRETPAPQFHHLALDVDDFEAVYKRAQELGVVDRRTLAPDVRELPDGSVQMYLRDPAGNLVEIDWPDISTLDRSVVTPIRRLEDERPQTGDAARATLYHTLRERATAQSQTPAA
jgi:lactoylglutathione lyase